MIRFIAAGLYVPLWNMPKYMKGMIPSTCLSAACKMCVHLPSNEWGNLSCFEGHIHAPSAHMMQEYFIQYFPGKTKGVLWSRKYGRYHYATVTKFVNLQCSLESSGM
jgi:hypothetical protein